MGDKTYKLIKRTCPVCGKIFFPTPAHVYKDKRTPRYVCSWSCVLESERLKEAAKTNKSERGGAK